MLTNRKAPERKGKVQLIDATTFWVSMRKSLGDKRRQIPRTKTEEILQILADHQHDDSRTVSKDGGESSVVVSKIFPPT